MTGACPFVKYIIAGTVSPVSLCVLLLFFFSLFLSPSISLGSMVCLSYAVTFLNAKAYLSVIWYFNIKNSYSSDCHSSEMISTSTQFGELGFRELSVCVCVSMRVFNEY